MSKKARPVESIFDIIELQNTCIEFLTANEKFDSREKWFEAFKLINDSTKGYISEDTLQLLLIIDEYGLWRFKRFILKLKQKLMRDFNTLRQIYVTKGLLQLPYVKQYDALAPIDYGELFK